MKRTQTWILDIVEGRRNDITGAVVRVVLFIFSLVYRLAVNIRNWAFRQGWLKTKSVDAVVVSVGNLTTGGTGKTPHVIWLAERLKNQCQVAIVSRGYGVDQQQQKSQQDQLNDEGMEIAARLPGIVQFQHRDRVAAAQQARQELKNRDEKRKPVIIADDGFQHRYLQRNLNIVLIDATNPFGYGYLLPRGLLREPIASIRRADIAILTRSDAIDGDSVAEIREQLFKFHPSLIWCETKLVAIRLQSANREELPLTFLSDKKVLAFCGIGNPDGFNQSLRRLNIDIVELRKFPDHHQYSLADLQGVSDRARQLGCDAVVCTQKDMVKVEALLSASSAELSKSLPTLSLLTDVQFMHGEQDLLDAIDKSMRQQSVANGTA